MPGPLFVPACFWPCCRQPTRRNVWRLDATTLSTLATGYVAEGGGGLRLFSTGKLATVTETVGARLSTALGVEWSTPLEVPVVRPEIAVGPDDALHLTDGAEIVKLDAAGDEVGGNWPVSTRFSGFNFGLAADAAGAVYTFAGDVSGVSRVRKYDAAGVQQWNSSDIWGPAGNPGVAGPLTGSFVRRLYYDATAGVVWAIASDKLRQLDPANGATLLTIDLPGTGGSSAGFTGVNWHTVFVEETSGDLYVAGRDLVVSGITPDWRYYRRRYDASGVLQATVVSHTDVEPAGLWSDGTTLWGFHTPDDGAFGVVRYDASDLSVQASRSLGVSITDLWHDGTDLLLRTLDLTA